MPSRPCTQSSTLVGKASAEQAWLVRTCVVTSLGCPNGWFVRNPSCFNFQHCYIHTVAVQKVPILIQEVLSFLVKEDEDHKEIIFVTHPVTYIEMMMDFMDTYCHVQMACFC